MLVQLLSMKKVPTEPTQTWKVLNIHLTQNFDHISALFVLLVLFIICENKQQHECLGDDVIKAVKAVIRKSRYYDTGARTGITKTDRTNPKMCTRLCACLLCFLKLVSQ